MSHERVTAVSGWQWITRGWYLFTRSPGLWVVLALVVGVLLMVLNWLPLIGPLVAALIGPALLGGMTYGARELDAGRPLEFGHLFQAFRTSDRTGPMLVLGLVPMVTSLIMLVIFVAFIGAAVTSNGGPATAATPGSIILLLIVSLAISLVTGALLMFAVPRVMLGLATPLDAVTQSIVAVRDNLGAFLVFALVYILLSIIAAIPFGLGFLVLAPVVACGVHAAHREVFGDEPLADEAAMAED